MVFRYLTVTRAVWFLVTVGSASRFADYATYILLVHDRFEGPLLTDPYVQNRSVRTRSTRTQSGSGAGTLDTVGWDTRLSPRSHHLTRPTLEHSTRWGGSVPLPRAARYRSKQTHGSAATTEETGESNDVGVQFRRQSVVQWPLSGLKVPLISHSWIQWGLPASFSPSFRSICHAPRVTSHRSLRPHRSHSRTVGFFNCALITGFGNWIHITVFLSGKHCRPKFFGSLHLTTSDRNWDRSAGSITATALGSNDDRSPERRRRLALQPSVDVHYSDLSPCLRGARTRRLPRERRERRTSRG